MNVSLPSSTYQRRFTPRQRRQKRVLMTHKYRGSIVVLSISKSVEPNEEQKDLTSGFQQGKICKHWNCGNKWLCGEMIRSKQQVTKVATVQQSGPIPFVSRNKPGQSLIGGKTLPRTHGNFCHASFIMFIWFAFVTLIVWYVGGPALGYCPYLDKHPTYD